MKKKKNFRVYLFCVNVAYIFLFTSSVETRPHVRMLDSAQKRYKYSNHVIDGLRAEICK